MSERRKGLTADERLAALGREQRRLRRERLARQVAGDRWRRMMAIVPALFVRVGELEVRRLLAPREAVLDALRDDAVFALDSAMRLAHGHGLLAGGDVHAYLTSRAPLTRLVGSGLIGAEPLRQRVLLPAWPEPPRLFASLVPELPPFRELASGFRVVEDARLRQELLGAVGARADLFALVERAQAGRPIG